MKDAVASLDLEGSGKKGGERNHYVPEFGSKW
jgi:hypothetical protein